MNIRLNLPLNRVEGDLEVGVELTDGRCNDAWCSGTMYRAFECILVGRGALDGLSWSSLHESVGFAAPLTLWPRLWPSRISRGSRHLRGL